MRQRHTRDAQTDPTGDARCACEVSEQTDAWCAKPRQLHAECRGCVDTSDFESRPTADAKGGPRLRQDAPDEREATEQRENVNTHTFGCFDESFQGPAACSGRQRSMLEDKEADFGSYKRSQDGKVA